MPGIICAGDMCLGDDKPIVRGKARAAPLAQARRSTPGGASCESGEALVVRSKHRRYAICKFDLTVYEFFIGSLSACQAVLPQRNLGD